MTHEFVTAACRAANLTAEALKHLDGTSTRVLAAFFYRGKPVVFIDKPPPFVRGACKSRHPTETSLVTTFAAPFHGVQLEWVVITPYVREVGHG